MKLLILSMAFLSIGFQQAQADTSAGYSCASYIRTSRPGVNYTLPYGDVFVVLLDAKHDALKRCRQSDGGRNYGLLCQTTCTAVK